MIMCVLLCYPVSIRIYYQQGVLFLVIFLVDVGATRLFLEIVDTQTKTMKFEACTWL